MPLPDETAGSALTYHFFQSICRVVFAGITDVREMAAPGAQITSMRHIFVAKIYFYSAQRREEMRMK
jgi:hypothetical protein